MAGLLGLLRAGYARRAAHRSIGRAPWLYAITLGAVMLSTLFAGAITLAWMNVHQAAQASERRAMSEPITVQLADTRVSPQRSEYARRLARDVGLLPEVAHVEVQSRMAKPAWFGARALASAPGDVPSAIEIYVHADTDPAFASALARQLEQRPGVAAARVWSDPRTGLDVRSIALGLTVFALLASGLMMWSVVRLTVMTHRAEISLLALLGATRQHIRGPHLLLGAGLCLVGTALAAGVLYLAFLAWWPELTQLLRQIAPAAGGGMGIAPSFFGPLHLALAGLLALLVGARAARSAVAHELEN